MAQLRAMRTAAGLAASGAAALAVGLLVYLGDRGAASAALLPTGWALGGGPGFGALGMWLPSFVHPFAFSLFTAALLPLRAVPAYGVCAAWCAVNLVFEIGQHPGVSGLLAQAVQETFGSGPVGTALARYFVRGTIDWGDIAAAVLGSLFAASLLRVAHAATPHQHAR